MEGEEKRKRKGRRGKELHGLFQRSSELTLHKRFFRKVFLFR